MSVTAVTVKRQLQSTNLFEQNWNNQTNTLTSMSNIKVSIANQVAHIELCKNQTLNALSKEFCAEIDQAVQICDDDASVKVMMISSTAKHFCAGADIAEMQSLRIEQVVEDEFVGCVKYLANAKKPIVVAVNGMALGGGCEL